MSLKISQRKLDRRIDYLRDIQDLKAKVNLSISNLIHGKLSEARKEVQLRNKKSYLARIERDEIFALKDIEKQAKKINKKYSKIFL